ncbi:MAG: glycogen-binding domain-containing protein [Candidatus Latescibacterota bacterium]
MRFSMWSCEVGSRAANRFQFSHIILIVLVAALLIGNLSTPARGAWQIVPQLRLSGGSESDQVIDPTLTRVVIPGGAFAEFAPDVTARGWLGRKTLVNVGTFATFQQFLNDQSRLLYAQTAWGNVFHNFSNSLRGRLSTSMDYFNDSEREAVRRMGLSGELGIIFVRSGWNAELWGSANGRRYANLTVRDLSGGLDTYAEGTWSGGSTIRISPTRNTHVTAGGILQRTDSRDAAFDANSWTINAGIDARLVSSLFFIASGAYQEREFISRAAGEDADKYWQIGLGLRYLILSGWETSLRAGYSKYTWPGGEDEDTYRLSLGVAYSWGRRDVLPLPAVDVEELMRGSGGSIQQNDGDGRIRLRVHAPGAMRVAVSGSFNSWNPEAAPLRPAGDGWWEVYIELPPGRYEYTYVIDGVWQTPPEAQITVDDGFGGRNGILDILPGEL